jgi:hypothetical protein
MNIAAFCSGMEDMLALYKHANIYEQSGTLFPTSNQQASWRFGKSDKQLHLSDGMQHHTFSIDSGALDGEQEADLTRTEGVSASVDKGAQVHRSDPSSLYFTMQDGYQNPTYTLKHVEGNRWKAIPKKRKVKAAADYLGNVFNFLTAPGRIRVPGTGATGLRARPHNWTDTALATALGAGAGAAYHGAKRKFYNTEEENMIEDEEGYKPILRRMLLPGALLGGVHAIENSLFTNDKGTGPIDMHLKGYPLHPLTAPTSVPQQQQQGVVNQPTPSHYNPSMSLRPTIPVPPSMFSSNQEYYNPQPLRKHRADDSRRALTPSDVYTSYLDTPIPGYQY